MVRTITVIDLRNTNKDSANAFQIKSMRNTVKYRIGDFLSETTVKDLISYKYNININPKK